MPKMGSIHHRDLAPVQIDLAAACTDSGKFSRKCETLLKNGAIVRSLGDTGTEMAPSLCWHFKLFNEGSFVEIGQEMTKLGWKVWKKSLQSLRAESMGRIHKVSRQIACGANRLARFSTRIHFVRWSSTSEVWRTFMEGKKGNYALPSLLGLPWVLYKNGFM